MRHLMPLFAAAVLVCLAPSSARADIPPPDTTQKKDGTASDTTKPKDSAATADSGKPSTGDDSGCAIGVQPWHARGLTLLALCVGLAFVVGFSRRRRRRRRDRR